MNKYNIEGGIDFFAELYSSLDDVNDTNDDDKNKCLITNQDLIDKFITLNCGHKFNYIPLYNDILNHKKKFNYMEGSAGKLGLSQIRCPYCRSKSEGVLPYYEELGLPKVNGVNCHEPPTKVGYKPCEYQVPNTNYNPSMPETDTNSPYKMCGGCGGSKIHLHINNPKHPDSPIVFIDNAIYCYGHKQEMIKKYKHELKQQMKDQIKQEKEQLKKEIQELKKQLKEEKKKEKQEQKQMDEENVVLGLTGCVQLLKTGPNKGNPCGCKIFSNNKCKRHSNYTNNIN